MKQKLLLFDGHSIANRAFYGVPLLTTKDGQYTNAVFGFLNMMLSLIEKEKPNLIGVAFDVSAPTFRHKFSAEYKGNRKGMPQELKPQIPLIKTVLRAMDIKIIEKEGYEADDVLGTLAKEAEKEGFAVTIVSGDRDLFQVTSDSIEIKIPRTKKTGTEIESFFEKDVWDTYGVSPQAFVDVKGLMGDASDNIKGVPGIGEKTAIKLIKEYGSIEVLLQNIDKITQKKLKENLTLHSQDAIDSKMLAKIICDVPLEYSLEEFEYNLSLNDEATGLLRELELKSILNKLPKSKTTSNERIEIQIEHFDVNTFKEFVATNESSSMGVSTFIVGNILGMAISNGIVIGYKEWNLEDEEEKNIVTEFLSNKNYKKVMHDTKPFKHKLFESGQRLEGVLFDTCIAAYLIHPTNKSYDLAELEEIFLDKQTIDTEETILGKGKSIKNWMEVDEVVRKEQITKRAIILLELYKNMESILQSQNMMDLFYDIEMPLIDVLFDMEIEGIKVDIEGLKSYGKELEELINLLTQSIYDKAGEEFNINSPKQLGVILFEKLQLPGAKKTKTGYSTAADVLETLKDGYPIIEQILEYRQYAKLKSTYVDGLISVLTSENKIHSTFNQTITATGRLSSTEPNLQNIPVKFEMGKKIRKLFIPSSKEYTFLDGDYSQIELRVLAHMANDNTLIHAFKENIDIHALTASQVFHIDMEEVTSIQRSNAKAVNFGIVYGISAFALSEDLKISQKEAQKYIEGYFSKYQNIKGYLEDIVGFGMQNGYVETLYHRKREIPEILSSNYNMREFGKRIAMNTPIQGTSADIIKIAMIKVHNKLKSQNMKSKLILTVHDELLVEAHVEEIDKVKTILKEEMENAATLRVPLSVDVHEGNNWLAVK